jgi:hypothetical protein
VPPEGVFIPSGIDVASTHIDGEGCVQPWDKPGLGQEIDWDWVKAHTVRLVELYASVIAARCFSGLR